MTRLIAAAFAAIQILVSFPLAHDHHHHDRAPECECAHGVGHVHDTLFHVEHEDCLACLLLNYVAIVGVTDESFVAHRFSEFEATYHNAACGHTARPSARAPPVC